MGYYINPEDCSKEEFLEKYGERITAEEALLHDFSSDSLPVCLVNNVLFSAAGIGYCKGEIECFASPRDQRPKKWYRVKKEILRPFYEVKEKIS